MFTVTYGVINNLLSSADLQFSKDFDDFWMQIISIRYGIDFCFTGQRPENPAAGMRPILNQRAYAWIGLLRFSGFDFLMKEFDLFLNDRIRAEAFFNGD